jgi:hypothetical protein
MEGVTREVLEDIKIPRGFQPLRLPDDIEETTNNQFGFILENSGNNNYSLNVKSLDTYEATKMKTSGGNGTAFMNASSCIEENMWYKVVAKISEDEVTAEVQDTNGTVIEKISTINNAVNVSKLVILLTNNTDRAVAFKNLNVEILNHQVQPVEDEEIATNWFELFATYGTFIILIATIFAVAVYVKKRRQV